MNFRIYTSIKQKLKFVFIGFTACITILCVIFYFYSVRLKHHYQIESSLAQLQILTLQARKFESNFLMYDTRNNKFMATGNSENVIQHDKTLLKMDTILGNLKSEKIIAELEMENDLAYLTETKNEYGAAFKSLVQKIRERGFKDYGLEGEMRKAVHKLENNTAFDKGDVLTLRKHEKDFIIRKDLAYNEKLNKTVKEISALKKDSISWGILKEYKNYFDRLVSIETLIGLGNEDGLKGNLKELTNNIEPRVQGLNVKIEAHINQTLSALRLAALIIAVLIIISTITFGWLFALSITKPIEILNEVVQSVVVDETYKTSLLSKINTKNEIGKLAVNFNLMLDKLSNSLNEARSQNKLLEKIAGEEKERNWVREGLAVLNEILRENTGSLTEKSDKVLVQLIKYLNANQGAFYLLNTKGEKEIMRMEACYAYGKKKFRSVEIAMGEGLIGSCWIEKDYILLTNLPQDFLQITSGLGEAKPNCVLIMPMVLRGKVEGIIEMVSFRKFEKHEIELVKRFAQQAATSFSSSKNEYSNDVLQTSPPYVDLFFKEKEIFENRMQEIRNENLIQAEEIKELKDELKVFDGLLGNIWDGFILTDENFKILRADEFAQYLLGVKDENIKGQNLPLTGRVSLIDKIDMDHRLTNLSDEISLLNQSGEKINIDLTICKAACGEGLVYAFLIRNLQKIKAGQTFKTPYELEDLNKFTELNF